MKHKKIIIHFLSSFTSLSPPSPLYSHTPSMANYTNHQTLTLTLIVLATLLAFYPTESRALNKTVYVPTEPRQFYDGVDGRRRLGPFQLCLDCRCCPAGSVDPTLCATLPCCFGIDCTLPDKPYGVCAFVPKSCNCTGCGM